MISPYHRSSELIRKRDSLGKESSATFSVLVEGRSHISSEKTKDFLDSTHSNSKSKSWRITIHLDYFPPRNCWVRMCFIGLQLDITMVLCNKI
jgi:hypothetical protein